MAGNVVVGSKRKWHRERASTWPARVVGQHALGTWVEMPHGTVHTGDDGTFWVQPWTAVELVPPSGRWHALFFGGPNHEPRAYVDLCESVTWQGDSYCYVDLYLDLLITPDGELVVLDADELDEAVQLGHMTADHAARVHADGEIAAALFLADDAALVAEGLTRWADLHRTTLDAAG
jgi:hypothetical protein